MEKEKIKGVVEAILFSTGRVVKIKELMTILELGSDEIISIIQELSQDYSKESRGLEVVRVEDGYQLASKKEYYEYLYPAFDKRNAQNLSQASLEVLAIIAYNPRATKADLDLIRGVDSSGTVYRLLDYNLIEQAGKADLPGRPMTYKVTEEFLKMFGLKSLKDLPELPKYKLDSNRQIVIDELAEQSDEVSNNLEEKQDVIAEQEKSEIKVEENNNKSIDADESENKGE